MKVHFQRLISLLLALVLCLSLFVLPVSAAEEQPVTSTGTIWSAFADSKWSGLFGQQIMGTVCGSVCPTSPDALHHGKVIEKNPNGKNWIALCSYCSEKFPVYDDDMQNAYDEHVGTLQNPVVHSSDSLLAYPSSSSNVSKISSLSDIVQESSDGSSSRVWFPDIHHLSYRYLGDKSTHTCFSTFFKVPVSGRYFFSYPVRVYSGGYRYLFKFGDQQQIAGTIPDCGTDYELPRQTSSSVYLSSDIIYCNQLYLSQPEIDGLWHDASVWLELVPDEGYFAGIVISSSDVDSRVGNLSGDFGIIGDNGTIIKSDTQYIVNETTNTYTNPATGATSPITDWTYDYSDRSYNLTLEGGTTTTVTYGDQNVTIKEGDTTYNIYYIVQGSGGGEVDPSPSPTVPPSEHVHKYASTVTTEPTCVGAGSKTYTCSECGDTYTEKIPATGHSWTVDRTINTTYDEDGNVLTQGYTIYRCSVCGNEYKDETGTGPPDDGKEDSGGGFLEWLGNKLGELLGAIGDGILGLIQTALGKILDGLIAIVTMISEKLETVVNTFFDCLDVLPGIFSGFTDFLTAGFAFLPPEVITVITFGILMMVLVAVIKLFLK